jgi:hypothetical protein
MIDVDEAKQRWTSQDAKLGSQQEHVDSFRNGNRHHASEKILHLYSHPL